MRDDAAVPVVVIANTTNRGVPAAINQGLKAARCEYLVLVRNDVVVTDGWLDQLMALANVKTGTEKDIAAENAEDAERKIEDKTEDPEMYFARRELRSRCGEGEAPTELASALGSHGGSPSPDVSAEATPPPSGGPVVSPSRGVIDAGEGQPGSDGASPSRGVIDAGEGQPGSDGASPSRSACAGRGSHDPALDGPDVCPARTEPRPPQSPRPSGGNGVAYVVRCACAPSRDGTKRQTVVDHVRLFPLRPGVRWTYRVHEQILPSLKRAKVPVRWTDLVVRHTGYADPAVEARKLERNIKILKRDLEKRPDDPFVLFNLGASAVEKGEWHDALGLLGRSLAGSAPADSIVRKLYALIARVHQMMGNSNEALRTCARGLKLDPEDAEL
jgi:Glycosyl transferase family 2